MSSRDAQRPVPRLVPELALPPYSYVTGRFPHPTGDPLGHSFGHAAAAPPPVDPEHPRDSREYLIGCDLFNHGYYWEAHEAWESLWHASGRHGLVAEFLQGLIKLAAAGVKAREGRAEGVRRHSTRALQLFAGVQAAQQRATFLGLNIEHLLGFAEQLERTPVTVEASTAPVEVIFDLVLLPE